MNWGELEGRIDPTSFRAMSVFESKFYPMTKLGKVVEINPTISFSNLFDEDDISFVPMENVDENFAEIKRTLSKKKKGHKGFTKFQDGDLLWAKITPCMQNGKSAIATNLINGVGCGSTEFYIIRAKTNTVLIEYIHFILRDKRILKYAENFFGGSAGQQRVSKNFLEHLPLPVPSIVTQQQIVGIMDAAYIEKKQKEKEAKELLNSINGYLLGELCIAMPPEEYNTLESRKFYTNSADVLGGRFDPRKYTKKYYDIFAAIQNSLLPKKQLREIVLFDVAGNWGLDEKEEGIDLISCLTIRATEFDNKYNLNLDNNRTKYRKYKPPVFEKISLSYEDILIEKSGGSDEQPVGRVAFIEKEMTDSFNLAYSNFIHKIIVNKNEADPRFVFEYLRLMHNIKVTQVMQTQTNGIRNLIMGEYFRQPILLPDINIQGTMACEAAAIRNKAKQLEQEADDAVKSAKAQVEKILLEGKS